MLHHKAVLINNIGQLLTMEGPAAPRTGRIMGELGLLRKAALIIEGEKIAFVGSADEAARHPLAERAHVLNAAGGVVAPGFCDSHTHPVFLEPRLVDFQLRLRGATYAEIKAGGGGIISSITGVREASAYELEKRVAERFNRFIACGTTSIEAKTGYGLNCESELKSLAVIHKAASRVKADVVSTLLAAHSVPPEFAGDTEKYTAHVISEILPRAAEKKLASFCDVFCEKNYFSVDQTVRVLAAARALGLKPKVHGEQLCRFGGAQAAARVGAVSVDHADYCDEQDISALAKSGVIATLLPASNCYLGLSKYPPARAMIDGGLAVALATDFNPGTSPCWNMQFVMALACTQMKMSPEEAFCAATVNGAWAMGLGDRAGVIAKGRQADIVIFDAGHYCEIPYYFGDNLVRLVLRRGEVAWQRSGAESKLRS